MSPMNPCYGGAFVALSEHRERESRRRGRKRSAARRAFRSIRAAIIGGTSLDGKTSRRHYPKHPPVDETAVLNAQVGCRMREAYLRRLGIQPSASKAMPRRGELLGAGLSLMPVVDNVGWQMSEPPPSRPGAELASAETFPSSLAKCDSFRASFLQTLALRQIWVAPSRRAPKHSTLMLFDWDDTLLCTSFVLSHGYAAARRSPEVLERLSAIAAASKRLLQMAQHYGRTIIVTNAGEGWVQHSARLHMPEITPALEGVKIISARHRHEQRFSDVGAWKREAFFELQRQEDAEAITNLVVIGDSDFEMDAAYAVQDKFPHAVVKTVKFQSNPSTADLLVQLRLTAERLDHIVTTGHSLRLTTARRPRGGPDGSA